EKTKFRDIREDINKWRNTPCSDSLSPHASTYNNLTFVETKSWCLRKLPASSSSMRGMPLLESQPCIKICVNHREWREMHHESIAKGTLIIIFGFTALGVQDCSSGGRGDRISVKMEKV
ncbi:hypothetical protein H1C71_009843, partial [Ictidomys tridecemlineatus]